MYKLFVTNQYGDELELTHNSAYAIVSVDGFDPPDATINLEHNAAQDGAVYKSSYANSRQITLTLKINGPAEQNRVTLYKYFKSKFWCRLRYVTATRDLYADGYVQSMQVAYFDQMETVQIVVQCPGAYLRNAGTNLQDFSMIDPLFEFPFAIDDVGIPFSEIILDLQKSLINGGDVETGALFTIRAIGTVVTPKIYNVDTAEHMFFDLTLQEGDQLFVNTRQNEKRITLRRNGVDTNAIGSLVNGSSWFVLEPGDNIFTIAADAGAEHMVVTVDVVDLYGGV